MHMTVYSFLLIIKAVVVRYVPSIYPLAALFIYKVHLRVSSSSSWTKGHFFLEVKFEKGTSWDLLKSSSLKRLQRLNVVRKISGQVAEIKKVWNIFMWLFFLCFIIFKEKRGPFLRKTFKLFIPAAFLLLTSFVWALKAEN